MKVLRTLRLSALLALCAAPGLGQSTDETLFDSPDAGVATESASSMADVTGKLLGTDLKTVLFGEFHAQATALWADSDPELSQSLSFDLGLTARPDQDLRIGARGTWTFDPVSATGDFHGSAISREATWPTSGWASSSSPGARASTSARLMS